MNRDAQGNLELIESSCGGCFEPVVFSPLANQWWHRGTGSITCGYWRTRDGAEHSTGKHAFVPWAEPNAQPLADVVRVAASYGIDARSIGVGPYQVQQLHRSILGDEVVDQAIINRKHAKAEQQRTYDTAAQAARRAARRR